MADLLAKYPTLTDLVESAEYERDERGRRISLTWTHSHQFEDEEGSFTQTTLTARHNKNRKEYDVGLMIEGYLPNQYTLMRIGPGYYAHVLTMPVSRHSVKSLDKAYFYGVRALHDMIKTGDPKVVALMEGHNYRTAAA
jgi:hypothetical protein